jgi:non-heme chloroperoxidase
MTQSATTTDQIDWANASGHTPVVFIHGLWLLASSWDRWARLFRQAGYAPVTPGWPDDPDTVEEANTVPSVFARKNVGQVAEQFATVIGELRHKPAVIGHSFGGLLTQIIAGRGLSCDGRDRSGALPRRPAAADLGAEGFLPSAQEPRQP